MRNKIKKEILSGIVCAALMLFTFFIADTFKNIAYLIIFLGGYITRDVTKMIEGED